MQFTDSVMMVRPAHFGFNEQTSLTNAFQNNPATSFTIKEAAQKEFDQMQQQLKASGVKVCVIEDTDEPIKPDAVFPNNWISFHKDGKVVLYPMEAENRRAERRKDIIENLKKEFRINELIDLTHYEQDGKFLEGTGSIVFDHENKIAYAALSSRTDPGILNALCELIGYDAFAFHAYDENKKPVYHTNVMMCIGRGFAVICSDTITDPFENKRIIKSLQNNGHKIIQITIGQMKKFAGNMLQLQNEKGESFLALSNAAYKVLTPAQKDTISEFTELLPIKIPTIETIGGGSVRCMIAENFLQRK